MGVYQWTGVPISRCTGVMVYRCTGAPVHVSVYRCTVIPMYWYTRITLYRCPDVLEYRCTGVPGYLCTGVPVYRCTSVLAYRCTMSQNRKRFMHRMSVGICWEGEGEEFKEQLFFDFGHCRPQNIEKNSTKSTSRSPGSNDTLFFGVPVAAPPQKTKKWLAKVWEKTVQSPPRG